MTAYDLVLRLPWFKTGNPEIDWAEGKLLSLRRQPTKPNDHGNLEARAGPDVQMLSAAALEASTKFSGAFDLTLGECRGMLGATWKATTTIVSDYFPKELDARAAAAAAVVAAEEHTRELE
jgi:hypothetical protein